MLFLIQDLSVVDQNKIDKLMLEMDGTENKCKMLLYVLGVIFDDTSDIKKKKLL